jgi:hypothetical protein
VTAQPKPFLIPFICHVCAFVLFSYDALQSVETTVDGVRLSLKRGKHYFASAMEMLMSSSSAGLKSKYPNVPAAGSL